MSKQTSYKCDLTNSFISEEMAVPVSVKLIQRKSDWMNQSNATHVKDASKQSPVDHVSAEVLNTVFDNDFNTLEILILGGEVVGYRNCRQHGPQTVTSEQAAFLKRLTFLGPKS